MKRKVLRIRVEHGRRSAGSSYVSWPPFWRDLPVDAMKRGAYDLCLKYRLARLGERFAGPSRAVPVAPGKKHGPSKRCRRSEERLPAALLEARLVGNPLLRWRSFMKATTVRAPPVGIWQGRT